MTESKTAKRDKEYERGRKAVAEGLTQGTPLSVHRSK